MVLLQSAVPGNTWGNDAPPVSAAKPLDLWVITATVLSQDTHTNPYEHKDTPTHVQQQLTANTDSVMQ